MLFTLAIIVLAVVVVGALLPALGVVAGSGLFGAALLFGNLAAAPTRGWRIARWLIIGAVAAAAIAAWRAFA